MKLVSIDDAQGGKELLNQWSERQRKKLRQRSQFSDLPRKQDTHVHPEEQSKFFCRSCYNGFKLVLIGKTDCVLSASLLLIEGPQRQKSYSLPLWSVCLPGSSTAVLPANASSWSTVGCHTPTAEHTYLAPGLEELLQDAQTELRAHIQESWYSW